MINSVFLLNKSFGITSNKFIKKFQRKIFCKKIGHLGTLDYTATGLLLIHSGQCNNNFLHTIINKKKRYLFVIKIGCSNDTLDVYGKIKFFSQEMMCNSINCLLHSILKMKYDKYQKVPGMSANKYNGISLYKYFRMEIYKIKKINSIKIYQIKILRKLKGLLVLDMICSKGTYIRAVINELSEYLQIPMSIIYIKRLNVGNYNLLDAYIT